MNLLENQPKMISHLFYQLQSSTTEEAFSESNCPAVLSYHQFPVRDALSQRVSAGYTPLEELLVIKLIF